MTHIKFFLFSVVLLAGCAFNQYQGDAGDSQYYETQIHADSSAAYVGEWTAATNVGIRSIKIKEDGRIKVCLSPSSGTTEGIVYMENEMPFFMIKTGTKAKIIDMDRDSLWLEIYGKQEKYYAGLVPDACASAFSNFK